MIQNCFVILNVTDDDAAVVEARKRLGKDITYPGKSGDDAPLLDVSMVAPSWGYPSRAVVTFDPSVRFWTEGQAKIDAMTDEQYQEACMANPMFRLTSVKLDAQCMLNGR